MSKSNVFGILLAFSASLLLGLSLLSESLQAQSGLSGIWEIKLDTQTGEQVWVATFD